MASNYKIGAIKRAIEHHIHPKNNRSDFYVDYGNWYCGVTNDDAMRKAQHKYTKNIDALYFKSWNCSSKNSSLEIEAYFHSKGMKGKSKSPGGVKTSSKYVYVFKIRTNIADDIAKFFELVE